MQIVFDSQSYYIADYPVLDGIEVIDKRSGLSTFLRDETAQRFRREFIELAQSNAGTDQLDDLIDHYGALMTQRTVYH